MINDKTADRNLSKLPTLSFSFLLSLPASRHGRTKKKCLLVDSSDEDFAFYPPLSLSFFVSLAEPVMPAVGMGSTTTTTNAYPCPYHGFQVWSGTRFCHAGQSLSVLFCQPVGFSWCSLDSEEEKERGCTCGGGGHVHKRGLAFFFFFAFVTNFGQSLVGLGFGLFLALVPTLVCLLWGFSFGFLAFVLNFGLPPLVRHLVALFLCSSFCTKRN